LVTRGFRPVGGFLYGLLGFLLALILTTAYYFYRLDQITNGNINIDEPQEVGWAFYNAHMVDITASAGGTTVQTFNALDTIDQLNAVVFYAIVAVMLLIAGYSAASRVTGPLSGAEGVVTGASVVIGYLPLLAAGTFLFTIQETGGSAGPELGGTLVIWGGIFSLVFGAVGGFLSSLSS
jgi:hypothetical protein